VFGKRKIEMFFKICLILKYKKICHTPIFDLRLYSGGVSLINGVHNCVNEISTGKILFGNDKLIN